MSEKILTLFAGVNGVGKSTFYNTLEDKSSVGKRINTDEIVRKLGDWKNEYDQIKASKIALSMRKEFLENNVSFNQETTLTGKSILKMIELAKIKGYKIHLYYVGVDNPSIAIERVKNRVKRGGHDIPNDTIKRRYYESLKNLKLIFNKVEFLKIYDNTKFYKLCLTKINGVVKISDTNPIWLKSIIDVLK